VIGADSGDTIVLLDVSNPEQGTVKEVVLEKGNGPDLKISEPIYSLATRRCVFVGEDSKGMALYLVRSGDRRSLKRLEPQASDNLIRDLAFSPDGRYLLFSSNRPDRPNHRHGDGKTRQ
jgi:dipeptidyl aminopeptidase/acylaminoacyl peptidase